MQNEEDAPFNSIWNCIDDFSHSPLDDMLERQDTTLEEVLNEDTLIQEVKGNNERVVAFLSRQDIFPRLLDYLTTSPAEPAQDASDDEKQQYELALFKYPFIVSEIISCDVDSINQAISNDSQLIGKFFDYLQNNTEEKINRNPARSGYVLQALGSILDKYFVQFAELLFKRHDDMKKDGKDLFQELVLNQMHLADMENFFLRILGFNVEKLLDQEFAMSALGMSSFKDLLLDSPSESTQSDEMKKTVKEWAMENEWIEKSIQFLDQHPKNEFIHLNIFATFSMVIEKQENPISKHIMSDKTLNSLIDMLLKHEQTPLFLHCIDFLQKIIQHNNVVYESDEEKHPMPAPIAIIAKRSPDFVNLLKKNIEGEIKTPTGVIKSTLGETRLSILQLFRILFQLDYSDIQGILTESKAFSSIVNVFFEYVHNNIMHTNVYTIMHSVIKFFENSVELIKESELLPKIVQTYKKNQQKEKNKEKTQSMMGHIVNIANDLSQAGKTNSDLAEVMQDVKGWDKFMRNYIAQKNEQINVDLGGGHTSSHSIDQTETSDSSSSDEDDDIILTSKSEILDDQNSQEESPAEETSQAKPESQPKVEADFGDDQFGDDDFEASFDS